MRSLRLIGVMLALAVVSQGCRLSPEGEFSNVPSAGSPLTLLYSWVNLPLTEGIVIRTDSPAPEPSGTYSFSVLPQLPDGLTLNSVTGQISGTPSDEEVPAASYTITMTDASGGGSAEASVVIGVSSSSPQAWASPSPYVMPTARSQHTITRLVDGSALIAGGLGSGGSPLSEAEVCAAGAGCVQVGPMNQARYGHEAVLLHDGTVLIVGGTGMSGDLQSAEIFNPQTRSFTPLSSQMPQSRSDFTATILDDGQVLIAGGISGGTILAEAEIYDPVAQTFSATGQLGTAREGATATLLGNGEVLVAGGYGGTDPSTLNSAELYSPSGSFTPGPNMSDPRINHTATLLPDGDVLIAGGDSSCSSASDCTTPQSTADLYIPMIPSGGTFSSASGMSPPRAFHTATLLPDGEVLLAGGDDGTGNSQASAELFDPAANSGAGAFTPTPTSMVIARESARAVMLSDGSILVTGGTGCNSGTCTTLSSTESFTASSPDP